MIDLHAHLLPEIDDGPDTMREALEMARAAHAAGIHTLVCTPHMIEQYPTAPIAVHEAVARTQAAIDREGIPLRLVPGAEIALSYLPRLSEDDLRLASIGGAGRWLLLEMPFHGWPVDLGHVMSNLEIRGYGVILAHPERADAVQRHPDRLRDIVGRGALVQLTASAFTGDHGEAARRTAAVLLAGGVAHLLATDAHSAASWRPPELEPGVQAAADAIDVPRRALDWMVDAGPAAILAGGPVRPPRIGRALRLTPDPDRPERRAAHAKSS
jgi:protein-tyrosine phosphatase